MGSTSSVSANIGWFSIPIDSAFFVARLGFDFVVILVSTTETGANSYCYVADKEGSLIWGQFAPQLVVRAR